MITKGDATIIEMREYISGLSQENDTLNEKIGNILDHLKKLELEVSNGETKIHDLDVELTKISKEKNVLCKKLGNSEHVNLQTLVKHLVCYLL